MLNDAYNANPVSMNAALEAVVALPAVRRIAVLGPMAELGAGSAEAHRAIGDRARALGVEVVSVGVGDGVLLDPAVVRERLSAGGAAAVVAVHAATPSAVGWL